MMVTKGLVLLVECQRRLGRIVPDSVMLIKHDDVLDGEDFKIIVNNNDLQLLTVWNR